MKRSWKTSVAGVSALLVALFTGVQAAFDSDPSTVISPESFTAFVLGVGMLFARDNDKSSEDVNTKKE